MMNLREYAQYQKDLYDLGASYTLNDAYKDPSLLGSGTDWQNEVTRNAPMQSHQLSLTGGNKTTQFSFSGGYMYRLRNINNRCYRPEMFQRDTSHQSRVGRS